MTEQQNSSTDGGTIELQDIQAIKLARIPLAPGTIVLLVGDNGSGKSTAITAVTDAISGKKSSLKPRDGKKSGKIRMPGVVIKVSGRMLREETGDPKKNFVVVEDGAGIEKILNPGLKDEEAADRKRLEGVMDVIGAELSEKTQQEFLGEYYAGFSKKCKPDGFVGTAKQIKLYLESQARVYVAKISEANGGITEIGEVPPAVTKSSEVQDLPSLRKTIENTQVEVRDARRDRTVADESLRSLEKLYGGLTLKEMDEGIKTASDQVESVSREVAGLKEEIAKLQSRLNARSEVEKSLKGDLANAVKSRDNRVALTATVDRALAEADIVAIEDGLKVLQSQYDSAILAERDKTELDSKRERLAKLKGEKEFAEAGESTLRTLISRIPSLFVNAMKDIPGWVVDEDMRLCVEHARGQIPFAELSPGEGAARACMLACQFADYEEGDIPVVGLPQESYEGLDGTNRKLLLDRVREYGLCLVTAKPSDEHVEGIDVQVL